MVRMFYRDLDNAQVLAYRLEQGTAAALMCCFDEIKPDFVQNNTHQRRMPAILRVKSATETVMIDGQYRNAARPGR